MLYGNILETIGNTPLVLLNKILAADGEKRLFVKAEFMNPAGSIKDRAAFYMLDDALKSGKINKNTVIIEPTSGNTGIGLSMACAVWGMKLILTMPESMSIERRKILAAYGAELVLTDKNKGMSGSIEEAERLNKITPNSFIPSQFTNPSNVRSHYETTAPEIFRDLPDTAAIVAGVGSGGTMAGIAKYVKEFKPECKLIAVEPAKSAVLSGGKAGAHGLQGIGAGFVPPLTAINDFYKIVPEIEEEAYLYARRMTAEEGIFTGITSGAAVAAAVKISAEIKGKIVIIVPDTGMRYLSSPLYE